MLILMMCSAGLEMARVLFRLYSISIQRGLSFCFSVRIEQ